MSGQLPPHKDGDNDRFSPPGRVTGRSNHNTPQQSDQERRNLIRSVMEQARASLELISQNPGMPQRADFPSHDAWLRALLTYSLQQSEDTQRFFGNHQVRNDQDDDSDLNEQEQGPDQQEQEEANDDPAS